MRRLPRALLILIIVTWAAAAHAEDELDACIEASQQGQVARDQEDLLTARTLFEACSTAPCPELIRADCRTWLDDLQRKIPSIALRVINAQGQDAVDVDVFVDGKLVTKRLTGDAIQVNPGPHSLRVEYADEDPVERQLVMTEGDLNRVVEIRFGADEPAVAAAPAPAPVTTTPTPPPADRASGGGIPAAAWALGGIAVLGGAGFAYFALRAHGEVDDMRQECAPACDPVRVDEAKRDALIANVALGVGVVSLAGAIYFAVSGNSPEAATERTASVLKLKVGAVPTRAGALGFLQSDF